MVAHLVSNVFVRLLRPVLQLSIGTSHDRMHGTKHGAAFPPEVAQPLAILVFEFGRRLELVRVQFVFELVVQTFAGIEQSQSLLDKLAKQLQFQQFLQKRSHGGRSRSDKLLIVKGDLLSGQQPKRLSIAAQHHDQGAQEHASDAISQQIAPRFEVLLQMVELNNKQRDRRVGR